MTGTLSISVAKDMMHATLYINRDNEHLLTKEYILNTLKSHDIKAGIHGRNKAFLKAKGSIYAKKQIIAKGKPGSIIGGTNMAG